MFSALPEDNVEYISFSKTALFIRNNVTKKVDIWEKIHFSKVIDKVGRILTSLKFCFISFLAFLCKAVTSINFKEEGKLSDLIAPFMLVHKSSANYFINNSRGISVFYKALVLSNLRICLSISPIFSKFGSFESNFGNSSFFTIFEKYLSKFLLFQIQMWVSFHFQSDLFSIWILTC